MNKMEYRQDDLWDVRTLFAFNQLNYDNIIYPNDLIGSEQCIKLSRISDDWIDGFEASKLHKNKTVKTRYFVPTIYAEKLPVKLTKVKKMRYDKKVYNLLLKPTSIRINPENVIGMNKLINSSGIETHSVPPEYSLFKLIVATCFLGKFCGGVVTESAFGKDKYIEMWRLLLNDISVLTDPTDAKLRSRIQHDKLVVISELPARQTGEDFHKFCNVLITIADDRQILDNSSRAVAGTKESAVIGNKSVLFIRNPDKYYHDKGKDGYAEIYPYNVQNRYLTFDLTGYTNANFQRKDYELYAEKYSSILKDWIKTALYYKYNWDSFVNEFDTEKYRFSKKEERYKTNFDRLAKTAYLYSEGDYDIYKSILDLAYSKYVMTDNKEKIKAWT